MSTKILPAKWKVFVPHHDCLIASKWCNENAMGRDSTNYRYITTETWLYSEFVQPATECFRRIKSIPLKGYTEISWEDFLALVVRHRKYEVHTRFKNAFKKLTGSEQFIFETGSSEYNTLADAGVLHLWTWDITEGAYRIEDNEGISYSYRITPEGIVAQDLKIPKEVLEELLTELSDITTVSWMLPDTIDITRYPLKVTGVKNMDIGCRTFSALKVLEAIKKYNKIYPLGTRKE